MCAEDVAVEMAEALAAKLTELGFAAERSWLPLVDAEDLATPRIYVAPSAHEQSLADRGGNYHTIELRIFVTQTIDDVYDVAKMDVPARMMAGIKRLYDNPANATVDCPHVGSLRSEPIAGARWTGSLVNNPLFDPQRLSESGIYIAQTVVAYRGRN